MKQVITRLQKLEQSLTLHTPRIWQVCLREGESEDAAMVRHGVHARPEDLVVIHRFGWCKACADSLSAANGAVVCMEAPTQVDKPQ